MDKSGARILAGCIFSTLLIVILFMLAYQFTQPSCELILLEPEVVGEASAGEWARLKPVSSHDKSLVIRLAAYLEYLPQELPAGGESPEILPSAPANNQTAPASPEPLPLAGPAAGSGNLPATNQPHPAPPAQHLSPAVQQNQTQKGLLQLHIEKSLGAQNQLANSSLPLPKLPNNIPANQTNSNSSSSQPLDLPQPAPTQKRRFLPLKLNDLELARNFEDVKAKYVLNFNCTLIKLVFVRRLERVHVESIKIELKLPNKHKSKCEVRLPHGTAFATEVDATSAMAHYKCARAQRFECYEPKNQQTPLVRLHIRGIQWETGNTIANSSHRQSEFVSAYRSCELPSQLAPQTTSQFPTPTPTNLTHGQL